MCRRLATLQADVHPHSFEQTKAVLAEAFGAEWDKVLQLEATPIGSGCMAQVYRGSVSVDGDDGRCTEVAVKVRHPGAREKVFLDLEVMMMGASLIEWLAPPVRYLALRDAVGHFQDFIVPQADLRIEAQNLEIFRRNFQYADTGRGMRVCFPRTLQPYVAEGALVETFEHGIGLNTMLATSDKSNALIDLIGESMTSIRDPVSKLCLDSFVQMLFADNFIHADMHPGNILFRYPDTPSLDGSSSFSSKLFKQDPPRDPEPELVILDAGLAVQLNRRDRRNFIELFHAIVMNNGHRCGELMLERSPGDPAVVIDAPGFISGVEHLVGKVRGAGLTLQDIRIGDLLGRMLNLACEHRVKLETSFVTVAVGIIVLEGVGRQLDPFTDLLGKARPLLVQAMSERLWEE